MVEPVTSVLMAVLKVASIAHGIAKFTGLLEDRLMIRVERLAGSELEGGIRALKQAARATGEEQSLLREARSRFNKALSLEREFRLGAAHLVPRHRGFDRLRS